MEYRYLTEKSPVSILIVRNSRILYANPAFLVFSGFNEGEVIGQDLLFFIDPSDHQEFARFTNNRMDETQEHGRSEFHFITKSGQQRVAIVLTSPVMDGTEATILINLVDISEKQRFEDKIRLDNERRRGIIITIAHELRTPLQPILGYLNLLIDDPHGYGITGETQKILERCLVSVDRERQIINQMLELSVLESGKLRLSYSKFPLLMLLKSVVDTSGYCSKAEITIEIPDNLIIIADMDRLFGVFDSLLSNAINFSTPPRKVTIIYRSQDHDNCHHIAVTDNGTGISESAFSSIFEPFQLADAAKLSRRYDRIGLSLSIAKKIMLMHGGDITVESILNSGSTFTLHLPKEGQNSS
jgi:PAS domain S-box-containing protein